jgi:hypothetical protein
MIASELIDKGEVIDFIRIDNNSFARSVVNQTKPFYARKSFLGKLCGWEGFIFSTR